jgi:hypothetical protein
MALEAGLAVVVDKPLAPTADEGRGSSRQRASAGRCLRSSRTGGWDGDFLTVKRLLADDALGNVHRFESRFERSRPELSGTWRERAEEAGGLLSGVRSHLWMSALAGQLGPRFRVLGDRAAFVKHGLDVQEEALRAGLKPNEPGWGEEPPESWGRLGVEGDLREVQTEPGNYRAFYEGVAASLGGAAPPVGPS